MKEDNKQNYPVERVFSKCKKCKTTVYHEIVSKSDDGAIEKMKCLACGYEHKFRTTGSKIKNRIARPKKIDPARDFNLLAETFKEKRRLHYSMSGLFKIGDVIEHTTFGMGIVISAANKQMEVVFSDHPRVLVFNREEMEISE